MGGEDVAGGEGAPVEGGGEGVGGPGEVDAPAGEAVLGEVAELGGGEGPGAFIEGDPQAAEAGDAQVFAVAADEAVALGQGAGEGDEVRRVLGDEHFAAEGPREGEEVGEVGLGAGDGLGEAEGGLEAGGAGVGGIPGPVGREVEGVTAGLQVAQKLPGGEVGALKAAGTAVGKGADEGGHRAELIGAHRHGEGVAEALGGDELAPGGQGIQGKGRRGKRYYEVYSFRYVSRFLY